VIGTVLVLIVIRSRGPPTVAAPHGHRVDRQGRGGPRDGAFALSELDEAVEEVLPAVLTAIPVNNWSEYRPYGTSEDTELQRLVILRSVRADDLVGSVAAALVETGRMSPESARELAEANVERLVAYTVGDTVSGVRARDRLPRHR
jgi:hypothetical protein